MLKNTVVIIREHKKYYFFKTNPFEFEERSIMEMYLMGDKRLIFSDDNADAGCVIFLVSDTLLPHIYVFLC